MKKELNISAILKDKPKGTKLYSTPFGECTFDGVTNDDDIRFLEQSNSPFLTDGYGKYSPNGECLVFPSKQMPNWSKFAWKKGDVLSCGVDNLCIFKKWENDEYTEFDAEFVTPDYSGAILKTKDWVNVTNENIVKQHISKIEEIKGGKLNLETLEIEQPKKPAFEIGKLYVFNEEDEDGNVTVIGKLIGKNESKDTLTFGNQYEIETEKFVTDQAFDLRISVHDELREATENEVELFNKHYAIWKKEKEAREQPAFKTFDKVLVRDSDTEEWEPAIFLRMSKEEEKKELPYQVFSLYYGFSYETAQCTPYEGNEYLAFTSDPF